MKRTYSIVNMYTQCRVLTDSPYRPSPTPGPSGSAVDTILVPVEDSMRLSRTDSSGLDGQMVPVFAAVVVVMVSVVLVVLGTPG